ncbi:phosphate signaling complex PhoU family protein [Halorussus pelagicus]|uniref:phosphate signaling complex PhoU family protein n=1 Tax=Halorussus pelagicus TaxID=2505977 RepID=UPI000FFB50F6|nr:phosphate uptake regulator PhoU [Halorussus pelagicus]
MSSSTTDTEISRKVQSVGGSSFTVSLPKDWATDHGLEAGNEVFLYPHEDGTLILRTCERGGGDDAPSVSVGDLSSDTLPWVVGALYVAGETRFALRTDGRFTSAERRAMTAAGNDLVGLEVADESTDSVTFRSMPRSQRLSLGQTVLNLRYVALSMHRSATSALLDADADRASEVLDQSADVDRQFALVSRCVERRISLPRGPSRPDVDRRTALDYFAIARELDGIASCAERIATVASELDATPTGSLEADLTDYARRSRRVVERAVEATINGRSLETAYEALEQCEALTADLDLLNPPSGESDEIDSYYVALLLDALDRTADHGGNVAERALKMRLRAE